MCSWFCVFCVLDSASKLCMPRSFVVSRSTSLTENWPFFLAAGIERRNNWCQSMNESGIEPLRSELCWELCEEFD